MEVEWDLSRSFTSDGQGIRCAALLGDSVILTGTQGGSLVQYDLLTGDLQVIPYQHSHAVTALLSNDKIYVTGCKDSVIRIFDHQHALLGELRGHAEKPVTSLAWADETFLISGCWDGTARIWNVETKALVAVLPDHENSVCVTGIRSVNDILTVATGTAGAVSHNIISGHTVRLWNVNTTTGQVQKLQSVANDHDGPIRDIHYSSGTLLTCSNDGTIKIRDEFTGICQSTLMFFAQQQQYPPMLLSIAAATDDTYVTTAEDGNVVVWDIKNHENGQPQIIRHAACVWNAIGLPNGDIATCCDDGVLRIFTKASDRMASVEEREKFVMDVQTAIQKTQGGPSADEIAKLPRWEDHMTMRGRSEGQVQVFQKQGVAIAAQWSDASQAWIEVGQVTGRSDTGTIDGVQYDHVFPIEIDQVGGTVATLQIGYNTGENPFVAAQRFIDAHMLPQHHLSQIAEYLQQRAGHQPIALGEQQPPPPAASSTPPVYYQYLPIRTYKCFDLTVKTAATTLDKMKSKLQEFAELADESPEMIQISNLTATLAASNRYHSSKIPDSELKVLASLLNNATPAKSFPALDLARLVVLHPDAADRPASFWVGILQRAIALCSTTTESFEGPAVTAIPMLCLRLFANAIKAGGAQQAAAIYLDLLLDCALQHAKSNNKNIRLSVATLIYNTSFFCYQKKDTLNASSSRKIVDIVNVILDTKTYEDDAIVRALVALGTICLASADSKPYANSLFLGSKVEMAASPHTDQARAVAKEVFNVLSL